MKNISNKFFLSIIILFSCNTQTVVASDPIVGVGICTIGFLYGCLVIKNQCDDGCIVCSKDCRKMCCFSPEELSKCCIFPDENDQLIQRQPEEQ